MVVVLQLLPQERWKIEKIREELRRKEEDIKRKEEQERKEKERKKAMKNFRKEQNLERQNLLIKEVLVSIC